MMEKAHYVHRIWISATGALLFLHLTRLHVARPTPLVYRATQLSFMALVTGCY
jgi:hypothetical protein